MVVRAGKINPDLGGHITSFASAATLYDVGWNHFWHAPSENHGGDLIYFQGHSAPGMYSRAFSKAVSRKNNWSSSARKSMARVCPAIRTRG